MAKRLTASEQTWSRPVIHDLFEAGGLIKYSVRDYSRNWVSQYSSTKSCAEAICNEVKFREFNFPKLDSALNQLSSSANFYPLHERGPGSKRLTANQLANIIAAFCAEHEIFWDDVNTLRTTTEMDTYRRTILGKSCWEFGCFLSQQAAKKPSAPRRAVVGSGERTAPKSGYKSSGPKSSYVRGLVGAPGEKTVLKPGTVVFVIQCDSTKPKKQYVYVSPLASSAVKLGDPSGYSDCKLFFDSYDKAIEVVNSIKERAKIPEHISGFTVAKQYADPNGYFAVETDYGIALIKASKLNESVEETVDAGNAERGFSEIANIDVYTEAFIDHV
jgi:hypothetical protein